MTTIKQQDFIQSIADAFQFISYYHPVDFIQAMAKAYEAEESPAAKNAIAQILVNSRMSAEGHRPMCQDTGIAVVFLKIGMNWPKLAIDLSAGAKRVDLETLTKAGTATWKAGDRLLLTGRIYTGRDAAHKRLTDLMVAGKALPVDLANRFIYYVGPVDPIPGEVVGPARTDHFAPHGQVHGADARGHRHAGLDR